MKADYTKGKIYKITNDFNDEVYIGSTCDTIVKRFSMHKKSCLTEEKKYRPLYKLMNDIGFNRFRIELICEYPCEDKYQLRQKEGEYIRTLGTLNCNIAGRSNKQYTEDNKEKIDKYHKEYRETHKKVIAERDKKYYEQNKEAILTRQKQEVICECGCPISVVHLPRHRRTKKHNDLMSNITPNH
jgi:adenylate kinase family enzyme